MRNRDFMKHAAILRENLYLDSEGNVRRLHDGYYNRFKKDDLVVPFTDPNGYSRIQVPNGIRATIVFHHVVYILAGKEIPLGYELDHIDGNRENNKVENLRVVTREINNKNRKKRSDNTSGITGVCWSESKQRFIVRRTVNGVRVSATLKTLQEALEHLERVTKEDTNYTSRHGQ